MASPVFANLSPADATQEVAVDAAISVEITDADGDLVAASVIITVDGTVAWTGDALANSWGGTKTPITNGFRYDLTPPSNYSIGKNIVVDLYAEDALSNILNDSTWNFFVVGKHFLFTRGLSSSSFLYSRDGGQTWTTLGTNWEGGPEYGIAMPALDQLWSIVESSSATRVRAGTNLSMAQVTRPFLISFSGPAKMHASAVDNVWLKEGWTGMWQYTGGSRFAVGSWTNRPISGVANTPNQNGGSLFVLSPTNVWACSRATNGGFIYNWNGSAWSQPLTARPWNTMWDSCHGSAADNVVFCGGLGSNIHGVVYRWNGSSFDDLSITASIGSSHITDVYTTGPDSIWVTVGSTSAQAEDGIWFWNGSVWTRVFAPLLGDGSNPRRWDSITGHGDVLLVAVSDNVAGTDLTGPVARFESGSGWSEVDSGVSHGSSSPKSVRDFYSILPALPPDTDPPVLQNLTPDVDDTEVPKDSTVTVEIFDDGDGVNVSTVILSLDVGAGAVVAWQSDAQQNGYSVVKSAITDGFRYVITPPVDFASYQLITARVQALDIATNALDDSYSFRVEDYGSPGIAAQFPTGTDVSKSTNVSFTLTDVGGSGVNSAALDATVQGVDAIIDGVFQAGYDGPASAIVANGSNGYDVVIDPTSTLPDYATIPVTVYAEDLEGNNTTSNWSFKTVDEIPPVIGNFTPVNGAVAQVADTTIGVDITDNAAVAPASVLIFVNSVLAYSAETAKNGFSVVRSVIASGYHYDVTHLLEWPYRSTVTVGVQASDIYGSATSEAISFTVVDNPDCFEGPLNTFEETLLSPFTAASLKRTEELRNTLLDALISVPRPVRAARALFLRAYSTELASVLRQIVTPPTTSETRVKLCFQRNNIEVNTYLRGKPLLVPAVIQELGGLKLPQVHRELLERYVLEDAPNTLVPLACLLVVLAKALESNELV